MSLIGNSVKIVKDNGEVYKKLNYIFYGLVIIGMFSAKFVPSSFNPISESPDNAVLFSYLHQFREIGFLGAFSVIFIVNLAMGSFAQITLPSLIIPFSGFLIGVPRMFIWGIIFSPFTRKLSFSHASILAGFLIVLLILFEGQGYILTLLGTYIHGRSFLFPEKNNLKNKKEGYLIGLKKIGYLYPIIAAVLLLSALLEAVSVSAF